MRTIALMDHHTGGHHFAFIKLFGKYFLKLGYTICIFFPDKHEELEAYYLTSGFQKNNFFIFPFSLKTRSFTAFGILNAAFNSLYLWQQSRKHLKKAERHFNIRFDSVFFAWLDNHIANYLPHQIVDNIFPYHWSGLYFHPWYLHDVELTNRVSFSSIDSVLKSKRCLSVGVHDEFVISKLESRINKPVIFFPEIADDSPPDNNYELANTLKGKSKGRIIIGLIGLSKRKGTLGLIALAQRADANLYYFFFAGKFPDAEYSAEEHSKATLFFKNLPENCFYNPSNVEEGGKINALICSIDILFLVYIDFRSSSNFITKAAYFKRIVLATNRFWIGRVTQKYNMGKTTNEGNIDEMIEALETLRAHIIKGDWDFFRYEEYLKVHGQRALEVALSDSLK